MKTRAGKPRDPVKERFWRRTIADQARCGLAIRAYCQREGLKPWTFRWWRHELARRDREVTTARQGGNPSPSTELALPSAFLSVRVVQDDPEPRAGFAPAEIVLPSGPTVRVTRGFDPRTLDAVPSVLEARGC